VRADEGRDHGGRTGDADRVSTLARADRTPIPNTLSESFDAVADELTQLRVRLMELLPDPSLTPDERLARLARVVPDSQLVTAHRRTLPGASLPIFVDVLMNWYLTIGTIGCRTLRGLSGWFPSRSARFRRASLD
jgi:hypothetical protein